MSTASLNDTGNFRKTDILPNLKHENTLDEMVKKLSGSSEDEQINLLDTISGYISKRKRINFNDFRQKMD